MENVVLRKVIVESVTPEQVVVRYGNEVTHMEILKGLSYPKDMFNPGDMGLIQYRHTGSFGLWFWLEKTQ